MRSDKASLLSGYVLLLVCPKPHVLVVAVAGLREKRLTETKAIEMFIYICERQTDNEGAMAYIIYLHYIFGMGQTVGIKECLD